MVCELGLVLKALSWFDIVMVEKSISWEVSVFKTLCLVRKLAIIKLQSNYKEVPGKILLNVHIIVETLEGNSRGEKKVMLLYTNISKPLVLFYISLTRYIYLFILNFHLSDFLFFVAYILFLLQTYFKLWFCKRILLEKGFSNQHNSCPIVFGITSLTSGINS